mmetsp:Transcript_70113/g.132171  ORF Transcript_70113/g.132171 Transcript_70113/m.132171 type:complete len:590 (-) Transcript_70113:312-2081(-)
MGEDAACNGLVAGGAPALEALKGRIMAEIEAKLSLKEEALWKRGQVEIMRLKQEHKDVKDSVDQLKEKQNSLLNENQKIRGALVEVTSRFERVVKEMREVLQVLQHQGAMASHTERLAQHLSPSPSVASTSASEAARDDQHSEPTPGTELMGSAERCHQQYPNSPTEQSHEMSGLDASPPPSTEDATGESKTFCTPPRMPGMPISAEDAALHSDASAAWGLAGSTPSPAVLSLASALPSGFGVSLTPNPSPSSAKDDNSPPHRQRLALAECLERQAPSFTTPCSDAGVAGTPPSARPTDTTPTAGSSIAAGTPAAALGGLVTVELVKEQGFVTLGMEVNQIDSMSLRVESVDEHGLVGRHNARQESDASRVREGDRIVEVNNIMHDPNQMLNECKVQQRLVLKLLRDPSCPPILSTPTPSRAGAIASNSESNEVNAEDAFAAADEEHQQKEGKLLSSPAATHRLRPEASVFVPSAQKTAAQQQQQHQDVPAAMQIPPGLEYDSNLVQLQPLLSLPAISPATLAPATAAGLRPSTLTVPPLLPQVGTGLSQPLAPLAPQLVPMMMDNHVVASPATATYDDSEEVKRALFP